MKSLYLWIFKIFNGFYLLSMDDFGLIFWKFIGNFKFFQHYVSSLELNLVNQNIKWCKTLNLSVK